MLELKGHQGTIFFNVIRSKRKSFQLSISADGELAVRAPLKATDQEVLKAVESKERWIFNKLEEIKKRKQLEPTQKVKRNSFTEGEHIPVLGAPYVLRLRLIQQKSEASHVELCGNEVYVYLPQKQPGLVRDILYCWYRYYAREYLVRRVAYYGELLGETYGKISVKEVKTRWGSCSSKRNLNFNWKLIMLPKEVLDYVVVHELCHLKEMNHGKNFWAEVKKVLPNYENTRAWLRENGNNGCISFDMDI